MDNCDRIKKALQQLCWAKGGSSQVNYARKVGLTQSYLSGIISGRKTSRLPLETMERIFPDLVVLPFGLNDAESPLEKEIFNALGRLSETDKIKVLAMISANFPYAVELPAKHKK
ncbi:MAG: helix-turn-helix transcriptional regulator [Lentisphaerae bacterium]|nr:helix-turn-helix transcriptional regulator [Lentisphaerota bacterium]